MFAMKDYAGDVLNITDEEIADNQRMGFLLALGRLVEAEALPDENSPVESPYTGSNREHIAGNADSKWHCRLMDIYDIREEEGSTVDTMVLTANAGCWCGRLVKHPVSLEIDIAELVSRVTSTDNN